MPDTDNPSTPVVPVGPARSTRQIILEEACKAICDCCELDGPPQYDQSDTPAGRENYGWRHHYDDGGIIDCTAGKLRDFMATTPATLTPVPVVAEPFEVRTAIDTCGCLTSIWDANDPEGREPEFRRCEKHTATTPSTVSREPLAKPMSKAELADYLDCPVPIRDLWNRLIELEEHVGTHDLKEFEPCEICREGGEYDTVRRQYEKAAIEYVDDLMQGQKSPSPEDWKKAKDFARGES